MNKIYHVLYFSEKKIKIKHKNIFCNIKLRIKNKNNAAENIKFIPKLY